MHGWVYQEEMKKIWLPNVKSLSINDVIESLPKEYQDQYSKTTLSPLRFDFSQTQSIIKHFDKFVGTRHQKFVGSMNTSSIYLSRKARVWGIFTVGIVGRKARLRMRKSLEGGSKIIK